MRYPLILSEQSRPPLQNMKNYFHHLINFPKLDEVYIDDALKSTYTFHEYPVSYSAGSLRFKNTNFFKLMKLKFGANNPSFIKLNPWTLYNWHTDKERNCAINWVLKSNPKASTLYKDTLERKHIHDIVEVDYRLLYPTILDTTHPHCVINNSDEERIILSLSIDRNFDYVSVRNYLSNIKVVNY